MNYSLCCISNKLGRKGVKFQKMTYTRFKSLPKAEAISTLSKRTLNNFVVTHKTIEHCIKIGLEGYRITSDITPVINHPEVNLQLEDLPDFDAINNTINFTGYSINHLTAIACTMGHIRLIKRSTIDVNAEISTCSKRQSSASPEQ